MKKIILSVMTTVLALSSAANTFAAGMGVVTHFDHKYPIEENMQKVIEVESEWIRDSSAWMGVETTKGVLRINDHNMNAFKTAKKNGINILCSLAYGNTLYTPESKFVLPTQDNKEYYDAFLNYVEFQLKELKDYIDAWEIWNEPNWKTFNYYNADGTEYAKLYLDCAKLIKKYDPTAKIVCGVVMGYTGTNIEYGKEIFNYLKTKGNVNEYVDVFSIHKYANNPEGEYADALNIWETVFDSYGYTGDVWMTENGASSHLDSTNTQYPPLTDDEQATYIARYGVQWERYLMENNRNGEVFWYDLKDDGGNASNIEHNYGLVDYNYANKKAFYAAQIYNQLTNDKNIVSYTPSESGYLAEFSDGVDKTYIAFGETQTIPLSGDTVYVYDYAGELTNIIDSPTGTITVNPTEEVVYVECVSDVTKFTELKYYQTKNVLEIKGVAPAEDSITLTLKKDGADYKTISLKVNDGVFKKTISIDEDGVYTVIAEDDSSTIQREVVCKKNTSFSMLKTITDSVVTYDVQNKKGSIQAVIADSYNGENVSVAVVSSDKDISTLTLSDFAYIGATSVLDGVISHTFTMPENTNGGYKVLLGRNGMSESGASPVFLTNAWEYAYVASLDISAEDNINVLANVLNYNSSSKTVSVMIAQYSSDNRLLKITEENKVIPANQTEIIPVSLSVSKENGMNSYKVFVWDSLGSMMPLCEVK